MDIVEVARGLRVAGAEGGKGLAVAARFEEPAEKFYLWAWRVVGRRDGGGCTRTKVDEECERDGGEKCRAYLVTPCVFADIDEDEVGGEA